MKTVKMIFKNSDGKIVEKEIEERLVSTYKAIGWEIKNEKETRKVESSFTSSKRFEK